MSLFHEFDFVFDFIIVSASLLSISELNLIDLSLISESNLYPIAVSINFTQYNDEAGTYSNTSRYLYRRES
jgi:hypothetical protein